MSNSHAAEKPIVAVIVGSKSDWELMRAAHETLDGFGIAHECRVMSAHRTPDECASYAREAEGRGFEVIIAGAGMAAALPGVLAAHTTLPVLGVPMPGQALAGLDSLLSIAQMPPGIPVGTMGLGRPGAVNAALMAVAILAISHPELRDKLKAYRVEQTAKVLENSIL
ncbi:MAG TPA: 5-(carboxyamino)imidazole ribonucleotide mutase [Armatimonadota bacterium]|jgi:5-(carboxyamino)imidazole ribonucleotide mutase